MPVPKDIQQQRMQICQDCEHFRQILRTCARCGCFMPAKTTLRGAKCPEDKWTKYGQRTV